MDNNYDLGYLCKLRDWIPIEKLKPFYLSQNPNAIRFLEQNPDMIAINLNGLLINPNAICILKKI
jgi:hypothetical protein